MKELLIVCFAVVAVWLIVSQVIAGLISSNRDHVVNMWACVFLAPFFTPMILLALFHQSFARFAKYTGFPVTPETNPMEYL